MFVVWGITLPEVATLEFEQLNGEVLTVVPEDLSGHFGIGFFLVTSHLAAYAVAMKGRGSLLGLYGTCSKMLGPARHTASTPARIQSKTGRSSS